jgi:chromosome segregation ATPase
MSEDDFELIPITPVRKLEREIQALKNQLKSSPDQTGLVNQIIEILRMNQSIVDQLSTKQGELINKINDTNQKLDKLSDSINSLVEELIAGAEEEVGSAAPMPAASDERLDKILEQNNALINSLSVIAKELSKAGEGTTK